MKLIHDSTSCLLQLLLLAELFVHSSSRPAHNLCGTFGAMIHQTSKVMDAAKKLHDLTEDELTHLETVDHRLDDLPQLPQTAAHFSSLKVNESLSELYLYTHSFRFHLNWLKNATENISLPSEPAEGATSDLLHLSTLIQTSLSQISEEVPEATPPSLPVVSTAFDALTFSIEISDRLKHFCDWSKRLLRVLKKQSHCPRR